MGSQGSRNLAAALLAAWALAGCQSPQRTPTLPVHNVSSTSDGEGSGWLFRRLTGEPEKPSEPKAKPAAATPAVAKTEEPKEKTPVKDLSQIDRYEQWLDRKQNGLKPEQGPVAVGEQSLSAAQAAKPASGDAKAKPGASLSHVPIEPDQDPGFEFSDLDPEKVWKKLKKTFGFGPNEALAQTAYRQAEELYKAKKYDEAVAKFQKAAGRWPDSTLEEDALFFEAESYFFSDRYSKAHDAYLVLLKKYTNSRYLDKAVSRQFAIGRYWEQVHRANPQWPVVPNLTDNSRPLFDTFGNAVNAYESVRLNDPTGPLADDAVMALGNLYFWRGYYDEAAHYYEIIRKDYPKSKHQVQAHILGLQAQRQNYQGAYYDKTALNKADEIAKQALTQFSDKLGEERANIMQARREMRDQRAERDFAAGQFYEKKRAYGASRMHYEGIIKDFPTSPYAAMAKERLEAIKDYPDSPPEPFKWLEELPGVKRK